MQTPSILYSDYLDLLFKNRNKYYGGYELRKNYERRLLKGLMFTILLTTSVSLLSLQRKKEVIDERVSLKPVVLSEIIFPEIPQPSNPKPAADHEGAAIPTVIAKDDQVQESETQDDVQHETASDVHGDGDRDTGGAVGSGDTNTGEEMIFTPEPPMNEIATYVSEMPRFNGDMHAYLAKNLRYPDVAREHHIEGRVVVRFIVNEDGSVEGAQIIKGIGGGCDEEALRVVNAMHPWKPGKQNGRSVRVYFTLPIVFELN